MQLYRSERTAAVQSRILEVALGLIGEDCWARRDEGDMCVGRGSCTRIVPQISHTSISPRPLPLPPRIIPSGRFEASPGGLRCVTAAHLTEVYHLVCGTAHGRCRQYAFMLLQRLAGQAPTLYRWGRDRGGRADGAGGQDSRGEAREQTLCR